MKKIIQQIIGNVVEEILGYLEREWSSRVDETVAALYSKADRMTPGIVSACLEEMDRALADGAKTMRRKDKITVKESPRNDPDEAGNGIVSY